MRASASSSAAEKAEAPKKKAEKLRFQFHYAPWKDVLDWFAKQTDLSLVMDVPPPGTFNLSPTREYTPAEAIDEMNSVLLMRNFILVRRDRMLMVVPTDDPTLLKTLIKTVPVEWLDGKGESEMANVIFSLTKIRPEDTEGEVRQLLGPAGSVVSLSKSQQLSVTDTVGRLRTIRDLLIRLEGPKGPWASSLKIVTLTNTRSDEVLPVLYQLLEIPDGKNISADGSIRIVQGGGERLVISGRPDKVARAVENHRESRTSCRCDGERFEWHSATGDLCAQRFRSGDGPAGLADGPGRAARRETLRRFQGGQPDRPGSPGRTCHHQGHSQTDAAGRTTGRGHSSDSRRSAKRDRFDQPAVPLLATQRIPRPRPRKS